VLIGNLKDSYVVLSGLNAGDKIVVEGIASLRNDMTINPDLVDGSNLSENPATGKQINN
jgi:membrane fusion protein (multidrug efflux system)